LLPGWEGDTTGEQKHDLKKRAGAAWEIQIKKACFCGSFLVKERLWGAGGGCDVTALKGGRCDFSEVARVQVRQSKGRNA